MKRAEKSAEQLREQEQEQKLKEAGKGSQCSAKSRKEYRWDTSSGEKGIKEAGKKSERYNTVQNVGEKARQSFSGIR